MLSPSIIVVSLFGTRKLLNVARTETGSVGVIIAPKRSASGGDSEEVANSKSNKKVIKTPAVESKPMGFYVLEDRRLVRSYFLLDLLKLWHQLCLFSSSILLSIWFCNGCDKRTSFLSFLARFIPIVVVPI